MLKLQHQNAFECKLATMAMLADVPLADVRKRACEIAQIKWWGTLIIDYQAKTYWDTVRVLAAELKIEQVILSQSYALSGSKHQALKHFTFTDRHSLTIEGRGELLIKWLSGSAHSVAYEDGWIYDPDQDKPLRLKAWLDICGSFDFIAKVG